jgi:hypothetical protein
VSKFSSGLLLTENEAIGISIQLSIKRFKEPSVDENYSLKSITAEKTEE